jgi:hypothetical protein
MVRRIFCHHNWTLHSRDRYAVTRGNGSKEGEVTLTLMECSKCGKDWLIPSDRTHSPNAEVSEVAVADSTKTRGVGPPLSLD